MLENLATLMRAKFLKPSLARESGYHTARQISETQFG